MIFLNSCGYGFSSLKNPWINDNISTVSVNIFKNNTFENDIEIFFTNALRTELSTRNTTLKYKSSNTDAYFEGTVLSIIINPAARVYGTTSTESAGGLPDKRVLAISYTLTVTINIKLIRNLDKKVLWNQNFTKSSSFNSGSYTDANQIKNVFIKDSSKKEAIRDLSDIICQSAVDTMLSDL